MTGEVVLLTDRPWPDDLVEREVLELAGFELVAGPAAVAAAEDITALVRTVQPAAIMTCWAPVTAAAISAAPGLQIVARMGVGLDNIDVQAARARGVVVTNVPDYCVDEVSDHAVAMVLNWTRGLHVADHRLRAGAPPAPTRLRRLRTLTCGIIGYGRIGRATAGKLAAFGCRVLATSEHQPTDPGAARWVELDELLASCDVVILHAPLTSRTSGMIGAAQLSRMRPGGLLVNVSRGALVQTTAVAESLAAGQLAAAALDVWESEPVFPESLRDFDQVLLTPHTAYSSDVSLTELRVSAAQEVVRVLRGAPPLHPCTPPLSPAKER